MGSKDLAGYGMPGAPARALKANRRKLRHVVLFCARNMRRETATFGDRVRSRTSAGHPRAQDEGRIERKLARIDNLEWAA